MGTGCGGHGSRRGGEGGGGLAAESQTGNKLMCTEKCLQSHGQKLRVSGSRGGGGCQLASTSAVFRDPTKSNCHQHKLSCFCWRQANNQHLSDRKQDASCGPCNSAKHVLANRPDHAHPCLPTATTIQSQRPPPPHLHTLRPPSKHHRPPPPEAIALLGHQVGVAVNEQHSTCVVGCA
eukprot:365856-Chlamydomonas_euryale.AAC.18